MFSGLGKGFLKGESLQGSKKKEDLIEVKVDEKDKNKNKLEIPEVQKAMQMNDYLTNNSKEWINDDLIN